MAVLTDMIVSIPDRKVIYLCGKHAGTGRFRREDQTSL